MRGSPLPMKLHNHDFHRIAYVLDELIREVSKHWAKESNTESDATRKQALVDCFYACKVIAVLVHPVAPTGCEMFREYMNLCEKLWSWDARTFERLCG